MKNSELTQEFVQNTYIVESRFSVEAQVIVLDMLYWWLISIKNYVEPWYQEENQRTDKSNSNKTPNTNIRVQMGCQQPQACLRQQHQNYKIQIGKGVSSI